MSYEIKNIDGGIMDVDDKSRRVKVVLNRTEMKDHDGDVIAKTAFDKTIKERGPKAKGLIWHLTDHNPSLKTAIARFKELYMDGQDLVGVTDIPNTTWGNDVLELYKTANINQHSIGFKTIKNEAKEDSQFGKYNLITEVMKYEGSAVLWGANEATPTVSVAKALTKSEMIDEYAKNIEELNKLSKLFKSGHLSDECFELLDMKVQQLTDRLQHLFTQATQPDAKSVEPDQMKDVFTNFINTLKRQDDGRERTTNATRAA
jgi:HK97 family phage prohead protease